VPDVITYNTAISACDEGCQWAMALALSQELRWQCLRPDDVTWGATTSACAGGGRWEEALTLLHALVEMSAELRTIACNAAISACERGENWQCAWQLLDAMPLQRVCRDVVGYNSVLLACSKCQLWQHALELQGALAKNTFQPDVHVYRLLLTECEHRGHQERESELLTQLRDSLFRGAGASVRIRLLSGAQAELSGAGTLPQGLNKRFRAAGAQTPVPLMPCRGARGSSDPLRWLPPKPSTGLIPASAAARLAPGAPYAKELQLLQHILRVASPNNATSVFTAMERFGVEARANSMSWLKLAGGDKATVLVASVVAAPSTPAAVLEIGTYCGYSALRLATALPRVHVVTLEVDPAHVLIARNVIAFAGLSQALTVLTGHSKDQLTRLWKHRPTASFAAVFMDQRGSLFHRDLASLEERGLLQLPGAVVVADNVLKPGAPLLLGHITAAEKPYRSQIVGVCEFAMHRLVKV